MSDEAPAPGRAGPPSGPSNSSASSGGGSRARIVALGVLASRLAGFARNKATTYYFGVGAVADVVTAALRVPNLLQNLLGDQAMAAAFIPIYSRLIGDGKHDEARRFAGALFGLLVAAVSVLVLVGVLAAPTLVALFNPGFLRDAARVAAGEQVLDRYALAVTAARVIFPMAGVLVLAAWAQGVLNSHRRFLLPYLAPVLWNASIITVLVASALHWGVVPALADVDQLARLVIALCVGAVLGGLLQFAVQLPAVWRTMGGFRPRLSWRVPHVTRSLRALGPALAGRGAVQLSFYLDQILAGALLPGALNALANGAMFYNLPFAVFATSVAASELPELASESRDKQALTERLGKGLRQVQFLVAPSMVGYLFFGFLIVGFFRGGRFGLEGQILVYGVMASYTLGMLASAPTRLLQNIFYASGDTKTPAWVAMGRVITAAMLGACAMLLLDRLSVAEVATWLGMTPDEATESVGEPLFLGATGLALGSALGAWLELVLLSRRLRDRLGIEVAPIRNAVPMLGAALLAALPALLLSWLARDLPWLVKMAIGPGLFALLYLGFAWRRGSPELARWIGRGPR